MTDLNTSLDQAFEQYRDDLGKAARKLKPTDGFLGFGHGLKDAHCHEAFDQKIGEIVCGTTPDTVDKQEAAAAVNRLLLNADECNWPDCAIWMLRAVQRHALPLIPRLAAEDAQMILKEYEKRYPRYDRLPVQREIIKALKKASG